MQKKIRKKRFLKNGRRITRDGYIEIYSPYHPNKNKNNCVLEHRLRMEQHIGRFLTDKEVVHHIDDDKENNKIENLELFSSVGKHTQKHHIVRDSKGKFTMKSEGCGKVALNIWDGKEYFQIMCGEDLSGKVRLCPACSGDEK